MEMVYRGAKHFPLKAPDRIPPLNNKPASRKRVLLEELLVAQLVKKFSAFSVNRSFITVFTRARFIQHTLSHLISLRPTLILMLSSHLCLGFPSGLFPSIELPIQIYYISCVLHAQSISYSLMS